MSDDNNSSVAQSHMTLHELLQDRARRIPDSPAIVGLERPTAQLSKPLRSGRGNGARVERSRDRAK